MADKVLAPIYPRSSACADRSQFVRRKNLDVSLELMKSNYLTLWIFASVSFAVCFGCGRNSSPTVDFKISRSRLEAPSGWKAFESATENYVLGLDTLDEESADQLLAEAERFITSDSRPHAHDLPRIPGFMKICAKFFVENGNSDRAIALLKQMAERGFLTAEDLNHADFASLAQREQFQEISKDLEQPPQDWLSKLLIREPPLFHLTDLRALDLEPTLIAPPANSVTVRYIGRKLSGVEYADEAIQAGANVIAIVNSEGQPIAGVESHTLQGNVLADLGLPTDITLFADTKGRVVAFLLPMSGANLCAGIVNELAVR